MGAHCPTKSASWCRSNSFSISEVAIDAPAAHKKASEGSLAVCSSMARATGPSLCSMGVVIKDFTKVRPHWIRLLIEMSAMGTVLTEAYGSFDRRFILQDNADAKKVNAVNDGVVKLHIARAKQPDPKQDRSEDFWDRFRWDAQAVRPE